MTDRTIPLDAILALVRYLEHDERKHFVEMQENGEDTSNHIYNSINAVADWFDAQPGSGAAYARWEDRHLNQPTPEFIIQAAEAIERESSAMKALYEQEEAARQG